jgi:glycosyltransferase involved in cell wall biosynthesis
MRKKTLTIDARMIDDSGIGTYLKNVLPYLFQDFNIILLGNREKLTRYTTTNKCKIVAFNAKIYSLKEQLFFPFIVPKTDILWVPHFNTPLLPVKAKERITTIHDVNHLSEISVVSTLKKIYSKILYLNAIKRSRKIITVSNFSKNEIVKFTNADSAKIKVIYCGVSEGFKTYKPLKIALPEKYILFVGNVKPHKNIKVLLEAYSNLSKELRTTYKIVVLGKRSGFITPDKSVFKYIEKENLTSAVFFTDYIKDEFVSSIYKNAQLLVFPSLYEGFGLPVIESMTVGTPVLCSNFASLPEIGGDAANYFNPKNVKELTSKIELLLTNKALAEAYIEKGIEHVKKFSWKKSAEKHINLIKNNEEI